MKVDAQAARGRMATGPFGYGDGRSTGNSDGAGVGINDDVGDGGILIGWGQVRHTRLRPTPHAFNYPNAFLLLPMRRLAREGRAALALNRPAWLAFHDADHGDGRAPQAGGALGWLEELLAAHGVCDADGEIWLQALPRVAGHTFKPVSFWYAHRADGSLAAVVAEVNNTFGQRHCYLLPAARWGQPMEAAKVLYVSPFCAVEGGYRFVFMRCRDVCGRERLVARVDHHNSAGPLLRTSWSGHLQPATAKAVRRLAWRFPLLTLSIVARIHAQALRLWLKRTPWWRVPPPPSTFVSR